jgi:membrane-bound lytic murein transglycosylase
LALGVTAEKKRERMKHMTRFGISHQKQKERHNSIGIHLHGYSSDPIQAHKVKDEQPKRAKMSFRKDKHKIASSNRGATQSDIVTEDILFSSGARIDMELNMKQMIDIPRQNHASLR